MSRKLDSSLAKSGRQGAKRKPDRRVVQTRDALGDALVRLMQEKPFRSITVQQVLDRAGIGRSTFYSHYRDKDDLFFSDVEDFWESASTAALRMPEGSNRVAPVRELFAHVASVRPFYDALMTSGRIHEVMELGQGHFARSIEKNLLRSLSRAAILPKNSGVSAELRCKVMAEALAGAMFSLLAWWIRHSTPVSAEQVDVLFHELVSTGAFGESRPPKLHGPSTGRATP